MKYFFNFVYFLSFLVVPLISKAEINYIYNREKAVAYAYKFSENLGKKRNPLYPDFKEDCTNFASQIVYESLLGIKMEGDGFCDAEINNNEWYMYAGRDKCPWYKRWFSWKWHWSTAWSTSLGFYQYFVKNKQLATSKIYEYEDWNLLRKEAEIGDFLQLRSKDGGSKFHTMIITKKEIFKNNGTITPLLPEEIYLTYHSGTDDKDMVDLPLSMLFKLFRDEETLKNRKNHEYWLIKFK